MAQVMYISVELLRAMGSMTFREVFAATLSAPGSKGEVYYEIY
jgi:hypothetical protein